MDVAYAHENLTISPIKTVPKATHIVIFLNWGPASLRMGNLLAPEAGHAQSELNAVRG